MSTISGTTINTGITLGTGTYTSPLTITSTGAVTASSGDAIYGNIPSPTIANQGTVTAIGVTGDGVDLTLGGSIGNTGAGLIQGYAGVYITGAFASVTNSGTIAGTGASGDGVYLGQGGSIANNGGLIEGSGGVYISGTAGTVTNSGTIRGTSGSGVNLSAGGSILNSGTILAPNTVYAVAITGTGYLSNSQSGYIGSGGVIISGGAGTVTNAGTILDTNGVGINLAAGGTVVDSGTVSGSGGTAVYFGGTGSNLLVLEQGYKLVGGVYGTLTATNTLELGGSVGAALTVGYSGLSLTNFGDVLFGSGGYDRLAVGGTAGTLPATISGLTLTSDIIDLTAIGTDGSITSQSGTQITIAGSLGTVILTLDPSDGTVFTTAGDGGTGTELAACFLRGTLIMTEHGEVAVEDLAIGDPVVTFSGAARPIKWIGRRAYDGRFVVANRAVLPIRVEAGALLDGVPARDLWISPEHALYIDDLLVPAGLLANGITIRQVESIDRLEYFHIELAAHDVILAEGAAAESFVDCDNRFMFQNGGEFAALYPDEVPVPWDFCAPRAQPGSPELAAIRAALLRRAGVLGRVTSDPDLHLIADGEIVRAQSVAGRVWRFALPESTRALAIASCSVVPAAADPAAVDQRTLGVSVERVILGGAGLRVEIGHDCPALCEGFHADEGAHRWTDGMARLPEALLRPLSGNITVELHLTETELCYRLDAPADVAKAKTKKRSIRQATAPKSQRPHLKQGLRSRWRDRALG